MAGERTEKATPKRRSEARKKGQVARSQEVNSTAVLLAAAAALAVAGPAMASNLSSLLTETMQRVSQPDVTTETISGLMTHWAMAVGPARTGAGCRRARRRARQRDPEQARLHARRDPPRLQEGVADRRHQAPRRRARADGVRQVDPEDRDRRRRRRDGAVARARPADAPRRDDAGRDRLLHRRPGAEALVLHPRGARAARRRRPDLPAPPAREADEDVEAERQGGVAPQEHRAGDQERDPPPGHADVAPADARADFLRRRRSSRTRRTSRSPCATAATCPRRRSSPRART